MRIQMMAAMAAAFLAGTTAFAAGPATKDDAMAMVKKAVTMIKAEGPEKAYAEINKGGEFLNGELYVIVQTFDAKMLVQSANNKMIGKDLIDAQDVDGNYFSRDLDELGRKQVSFWYSFKFVNPATKKIQPKDIYCERVAAAWRRWQGFWGGNEEGGRLAAKRPPVTISAARFSVHSRVSGNPMKQELGPRFRGDERRELWSLRP